MPERRQEQEESAGKRPKAAWHCEIAALKAQIPEIFCAPAARQVRVRPLTSVIMVNVNVTVGAAVETQRRQ